MLRSCGQAGHDGLRFAGRNQFAGRVNIAINARRGRIVEPFPAHPHACAIAGTEVVDDVGAAVAIRIAQGHEAVVVKFRIQVAVRCDGEKTQRAAFEARDEIVRHDESAKTGWQCEAAVVGIRHWQSRKGGRGQPQKQAGGKSG